MQHITKTFNNIVANDDVTLTLKKGEIHALVGENGAGKSTLMSVLFGLYKPEKGQILKQGQVVHIKDPNDATKLGIGMVHQHFKQVDCFSALDNIILGDEDTKIGFVSKKKAREKIQKLCHDYNLTLNLDAKVSDISVVEQQKIEILKMLYRDNDILIFDEPTAVLDPGEIESLLKIIVKLKDEGKSILFISHKLNEVMQISNRISVLRKGKYIGTVNAKDTTKEKILEMMVGHSIELNINKKTSKPSDVVLQVQNLTIKGTHKNILTDVSIHVRKKEIVGLAGISGNGQNELVQAITGLIKPTSGNIVFNGEQINNKSIRYRNTHGLSHIPEDRHKHGLILDYTLEQNLILQRYFDRDFQKHGIILSKNVIGYTDKLIDKYDVRSPEGGKTITRVMSGGNQQKAIIAREMERNHDLLIAVQPTRGIDASAGLDIHKKIIKDRDSGKGILLVSLELEEILQLSDRIYVIHEGEIVGVLNPKITNVKELGLYMSGVKKDKVNEEYING